MIEASYPWGEAFQQKLLALLLQEPDKMLGVIEPRFFTSPIRVDIARIMRDIFSEHRKKPISLSKVTLKELVRGSLGRKEENWPLYRREIRKIYKTHLKDKQILFDQAREFAREYRHRDALVKAEKEISAGRYDRVSELFEKLQAGEGADGLDLSKWKNLPKYDDYPFEEVDWLVEGFLPAGSAIALSGDEGVGKTLFALALSRSLTEGFPLLGRDVQVRRVLYLGLDISKVTLQSYVRAMRWEPNGYFRFLTMWTGEGKEAPMIDDPEGVALLYRLAAQYRPVIIVDTLRDFFDGEENSSTDTKPVLDTVRKLRALGATIILIAHPPKKGKSVIRGTGNISQKVDIPYLMAKQQWEGKDVVVLTCPKKNRFGSTSFRLPMRQLFIPTPAGPRFVIMEVAEWKPSEESKQKGANVMVIQYVKDHPGTNQKIIQGALKMSDRNVKNALLTAKKDGLLRVEKGKRRELCWYDAESKDNAVAKDLKGKLNPKSKTL